MSDRKSPNDALLSAFMLNLAHKRMQLTNLSNRLEAAKQRQEAELFWKQFEAVDFNINRLDPFDPANMRQHDENTDHGS